jgi:carboxyl-terminal processing protease
VLIRRVLSSIGLTLALLCPATAFAQNPPTSCTTTSQNLYVRDVLSNYYYWQSFLPVGVNPASFTSPEAYLEAVRYRPIDNSYSYIQSAAANDAFYSDSQAIKYGLTTQTTPTYLQVLETWVGSTAREAGMARGDRILEINGQSVAAMISNGTLGSAFGAEQIGVTTSVVFQKPSGERRSATMTKRLVTIPTVSLTSVVEYDGRRVGYLFFYNFVRPSFDALDEAFASLKAAGANELVLDLRYNGGGLVDVAVHLASLIGGARTNGQVMMTYTHSGRAVVLNKVTRFENPAQALTLNRLFVITTGSSASASELVINALKPYMPVAVIGSTTYGKPVGAYGFSFCDKVLAAISFSLRNANDEGDYFTGIAPTCAAADDPTHFLGEPAEGSFAEALNYMRTGACSATADAAARTQRAMWAPPRPVGWAALINAQ